MRIFNGIPANGDYETIRDAVVAVVRQARAQGLGKSPWSLVELRPDHDDFAWLCDWMHQLRFGIASRCLEEGQWHKWMLDGLTFSYSVGIGTLLFLSATEVARREATSDSLWTAVRQGTFTETTRTLLFLQGYPTRAYKDAIEQSARWLGLRHIFGIEGLQNWYGTLYLQFGFSQQGFMRRLPEWLSGQGQPQSIQQLLAGRLRSETFCILWEALRHFRHNNWKEAQLRLLLHENPWVLPEWDDDLMKQAKARLYLGQGSGAISDAAGIDVREPFLRTPQLHWDLVHPPRFTCAVTNLATLDLQESVYHIVVTGKSYARLQRATDGTYLASVSEIELPASRSLLVASLITQDGQVAESLTIELWDENEDVTAFYASSGQRFDPWKKVLHPNIGVFLLLSADLSVEPDVRHWHTLPHQRGKLYYLAPGWSPHTRVLLDNQLLWQPSLSLTDDRERPMSEDIGVQLFEPSDHLFFGESIRLVLTLPIGKSLAFLRAGRQPLAFEQLGKNQVLTEPFAVTPKIFRVEEVCRIELLLGVRTGATIIRLHRLVDLPITGAAILTPQGWTALRTDDALEREQACTQPIKIFVMDSDRWVLLEGDRGIERLWKTPRPLTALSGLGAPLKLCEGAYNLYREPRILVHEVIDKGLLVTVEVDAPGTYTRTLSVQLSQAIEADASHTIHWWDRIGTFETIIPECCELQGQAMWWLANIPPDLTEPMAIALAYNGIRLGTWWSADWVACLHQTVRQTPQTSAALLRWFHFPLLSSCFQEEVRRFAFTYPGETLAAWVGNSGLPHLLRWNECDDGWLSAVRAIFWSWQPADTSIKLIMAPLLPDDTNHNPREFLPAIAWKLLRVNPLLMGLIVKRWACDVGIPCWGRAHVRALIQQFMYDLTEAESSRDFYKKRASLSEQVATNMGVDPAFVEKALIGRATSLFQGQATSHLDHENITVAMNVEPFRRLLGVKLLEVIDCTLGERREQ